MKNLLIVLSVIALIYTPTVYNQSISAEFKKAMDFYNQQLYADAQKVFDKIIKDYGIEDEIYTSARFYSANSLLKMGKKDEAACGFEFIVNAVVWSKFREESLFTLGLIYYDLYRYALCRKNLLMLIYQ